jgi:quaternary ammonium compound-resistance protein SugE
LSERADTEGKKPGRSIFYFSRALLVNVQQEGSAMKSSEKKKERLAWLCLIAAGLIEIIWAYFMKLSYGFTKPVPTIITAAFLFLSFFMLEKGISRFGIGMSYAVFTGIGIAGTTVIGLLLLGESASPLKLLSLAVLIAGITGLKFCEGGQAHIETKDSNEKEIRNAKECDE